MDAEEVDDVERLGKSMGRLGGCYGWSGLLYTKSV